MSDQRPPTPPATAQTIEVIGYIRETGETDQFTDAEMSSISGRLGALALRDDTVLAEHQVEAFRDIVGFFHEGGREGYAKLPTGTGKTVLAVELVKELFDSTPDDEELRVLWLVPTKDLVDQTVGSVDKKTGKRRGFAGFAPEIVALPHHSDVPGGRKVLDENLLSAQVLVTTYSGFRKLVRGFEQAESKTVEEWLLYKEDCLQQRDEAKGKLAELVAERAAFIRSAYISQTLQQASELANNQLNEVSGRRLTRKERAGLLSIKGIVDNEDTSDESKYGLLIKQVRKMMTPRVQEALISEIERQAKAQATRQRNIKLRQQQRKDGKTPEPINQTVEEPAVEEEIDHITYRDLNEIETFVLRFTYRHRRSGNHNPGANDLHRLRDRQMVFDYNASISMSRSSMAGYNREAKAVEHFINLRRLGKSYSLIIGDEAHRSIGSQTWEAIRNYAKDRDIALLGLTATDEYYDRSLEDYFEKKAHELTQKEAMRKQIVNPTAIFTHDTGLRFHHVGLDAAGDYDKVTISEMRFSEERNQIGIEYAKLLTEHGYSGIMSAIPGDEGAHARMLASLLNRQVITDPVTGQERHLRARYVLDNSKNRQMYYRQFEAGKIDWLTFVDVIREGWDSDQAKALINMRPTRSPLLATQRAGRIGRTFPGAPISVVIDIHDGIEGEDRLDEIPPVLMTDVFDLDEVAQGHIVGAEVDELPAVIQSLRQRMTGIQHAYHTHYIEALAHVRAVNQSGIALVGTGETGDKRVLAGWQTFESLRKTMSGYLPKEVLIEAVESDPPKLQLMQGRTGQRLVPLFNVSEVQELVANEPLVNPWKLFVDDGVNWIAPEGCTVMLSKRFPNLKPEAVTDAVRQLEEDSGQQFTKRLGRIQLNFTDRHHNRMGVTQLYQLDEVTERLVPYLLENL